MVRSAMRRCTAASILTLFLLLECPAAAAAPSSAWLRAEQARFSSVLAQRPADVLVVPFQVSGNGFDPTERWLMTAVLADSLAAGTPLRVADPVLVSRALGEGLRTHDESSMRALAKQLRSRFLVIGSAGHDRGSRFRIDVRVLRADQADQWQEAGRKSWPSLTLSDQHPPHQGMSALAPAVAEMLMSKLRDARPSNAIDANAPGRLPTLQEILSSRATANLHVVQLLAIAYPRSPEAPAARAWIQSLRMAKSAADGPGRKLAVARALAHLGRRPAAIAALGTPRSEAEQALRAILDGNLPEAELLARKISDPVLRLLAQVEIRDLREAYLTEDRRAATEALRALIPQGSDWTPFLTARVRNESSRWGGEDASSIASRFHHVLGIGELDPRSLGELVESPGEEPPGLRIARVSLAAYDNQLRAPAPKGNAAFHGLLLDLLQAQVVAGMLGEGYATIDTRDLPDAGRDLLSMQEPLLAGHPDFEAMRANLAWREYARWRGKRRAQWQAEALAHTRAAYALSGWATGAVQNAEGRADWKADIVDQLQAIRIESFWTWPVQPEWLTHAVLEDPVALRWYADRAVEYADTEFAMLAWLKDRDLLADRRDAIDRAITGRFNGSADFAERRAVDLLMADDPAGAEAVLKRYVDARLTAFEPYREYLDLLISQGRYAEGYKMIQGHPSFAADAGGNRVAPSNYSGIAGGYFWNIGKFDLAMPLFEKSAGYDTHSNLSMDSAAKVALYARDFERAARWEMQAARRYSDIESLSEYFELIFALGRPDEAWRIYDEVHRDGNGGRVLYAIAQHSRQIGWSEERAIEWLSTPKNASLADDTFFYAPRAALGAAIIDREPVDLPAVLSRFNAPSPYVVDKVRGKVLRRIDPSRPASRKPEVCGPSRYGNGPVGGMANIDRADSSLTYFANGYQALARRQYGDAFRHLDAGARLYESYDADCEAVSYQLPYLALAAAHTRNTQALREYMAGVKYRDRNLNYHLVLAVLAAFEGRHAEAGKRLDSALNRWTSGRFQALPSAYVYADVLERMYEHTRHPDYRDRLVRWAKIQQRISPTDAWPYAKEYRYSNVAADRKTALGMALFLDARSATLKGVNDAEAAAARAQFNANNPFRSRKKTLAMQ